MMLRTKYKATTSVLSPSAAESARVEERETTGFRWKLTLFLFLSLVALNVYAPANPTLIQRGLASVLYVSSFIPLWLHASQKNRGIPFLPLFGMLYALYYAIPIFLLDGFAARFGFFVIQEAAIEMALWVAIIGWLSLLFAHYVWPGAFLRSGTRGFVLRWPPDSSKVWMVVVIYLGILATILKRLIPLPLALQGAVTFLETFLRFAFMGLLILQLKGYLGVGMKLFLWAGVAPLLFVMLTSSALVSQTLLLWISLILTYTGHCEEVSRGELFCWAGC